MRYLLRSLVCVLLSFCIVFSNSFCALASTTTEQVYNSFSYPVQPLVLYDEEFELLYGNVRIGDLQLNKFPFYTGSFLCGEIPTNQRFSEDIYSTHTISGTSSANSYDKYLQVIYTFKNETEGLGLFYPLLGLDFNAKGFYSNIGFRVDDTTFYYNFSTLKPVDAYYRYSSTHSDLIDSGTINLNDIKLNSDRSTSLSFTIPKDTTEISYATDLSIYLTYEIPDSLFNYDVSAENVFHVVVGFYGDDNYVYSDFISSGSSSSSSDSDYNKNVEAELGNIQTGINNVVNSVMQMGQQAWQGAQQTVQAVTQMTQQLNTAIDQQRQDILKGLGLLGDDIGATMDSVKTEISNMSSSISNKLESTTQSITNKIESTTETITSTIENKVDEVTSAVDEVKDSVVEVKSSILDLPNKLKEMLTGFFVPNEQTINSKYSEFETLLSDRFGLIYQSADIIHDFADSFQTQAVMTADTGGIITMPQVTVSLAGTPFTFGGYEVDIIPDGFETLQQMCRLAVSMVCTVVFINMLKSKLEWILR